MKDELVLRGPDLPEAVSWWPPALGWWIVLALLIIVVLFLFYRKRWRINSKRSVRKLAEKELQRIRDEHIDNPQRQVQSLSILLRRVAVAHFGRDHCAGVTGKEWLVLLDSVWDANDFSEGDGQIILDHPYRLMMRGDDLGNDAERLFQVVQRWLKVIT